MATGKITKRTLDSLLANDVSGYLWDDDLKGFGLRTSSSGAASYVVQYRMGGRESKTRRFTIGAYGSPWTPVTARAEAERLLLLVATGVDPVAADQQRRREAVDLAFSKYADHFATACTGKGWTTLVTRSLRLHVKPVLRDKPLPKITRPDIVVVFDRMPADQVGNRRNVFAVLRRLFKWAMSRGDIERSPMEGMETPPAVKARERWLNDSELGRIWTHAPRTHRCFGPIVRLLITTGQCREEVTSLDWEELNRADREWRLPGDRAKNGEPNMVPLNDLVIAELDRVAKGDAGLATVACFPHPAVPGLPPTRRARTSWTSWWQPMAAIPFRMASSRFAANAGDGLSAFRGSVRSDRGGPQSRGGVTFRRSGHLSASRLERGKAGGAAGLE